MATGICPCRAGRRNADEFSCLFSAIIFGRFSREPTVIRAFRETHPPKQKNNGQPIGYPLFLVEATGLEPTTFWSLTKRATKLRYASISFNIISLILWKVKHFFIKTQKKYIFLKNLFPLPFPHRILQLSSFRQCVHGAAIYLKTKQRSVKIRAPLFLLLFLNRTGFSLFQSRFFRRKAH